jgi:hypothetical protein
VLDLGLLTASGSNHQGSGVVFTDLEGLIQKIKVEVEFSENLSDQDGLLHSFAESLQFSFTGAQRHQLLESGSSANSTTEEHEQGT